MKVFAAPRFRLITFFILLMIFCLAPIWWVEYFINQDGSAHIYSSFLMLELLKGNPKIAGFIAFNSVSIPNSSGHWLMIVLLCLFSPFLVTKLIVTFTFTGFVASIGWLRLKTAGSNSLKTTFLYGAAIAFNWLWLVGFYNFLIGVVCFTFTIGLFFKWREKMNLWRALALTFLFLTAYFSHIVSFLILIGGVLMLLFCGSRENIRRNVFWIFCALIPILPLVLIYKSLSAGGGGFVPVWRNLENTFSAISWLNQIRTADPFIIISRKSLPFFKQNSSLFAVFTPIIWIFAAILSLFLVTLREKGRQFFFSKKTLPFFLLFVSTLVIATFAPDDFGLNNGSVLRERLLLCGLVFFVPLFHIESALKIKRFAQISLIFVIFFQTASLWEYALHTNQNAKEYLSVQKAVGKNENVASVILSEDILRFHSLPLSMINNYIGFESERFVWDNYELGHYLFPIVSKEEQTKRFVFDFTKSNSFSDIFSDEIVAEKTRLLDQSLSQNLPNIDVLIIWGFDSRVEPTLTKTFAIDNSYNSPNIRIFRRK